MLALVAISSALSADDADVFMSGVSPVREPTTQLVAMIDQMTEHDYGRCYDRGVSRGKFIVLVTRDNCEPCEKIKRTLDAMDTEYAIVNIDHDPVARKIIGSGRLTPEIVKYIRIDGQWTVDRRVGNKSRQQLELFLNSQTPADAYDGSIRLPGPRHALRGTMCGSRGCQMCVGIALRRNYGFSYSRLREIGGSRWLTLWDNLNNMPEPEDDDMSIYGETPPATVDMMLKFGGVQPGDIVYDLGSGDGRIAIAAAKQGATAIGYEIDHDLVEMSRRIAAKQGVSDRANFFEQNVLHADLQNADVVLMYLEGRVSEKMIDKFNQLDDVKIVCHEYPIPGVEHEGEVKSPDGKSLYLYKTPLIPST